MSRTIALAVLAIVGTYAVFVFISLESDFREWHCVTRFLFVYIAGCVAAASFAVANREA